MPTNRKMQRGGPRLLENIRILWPTEAEVVHGTVSDGPFGQCEAVGVLLGFPNTDAKMHLAFKREAAEMLQELLTAMLMDLAQKEAQEQAKAAPKKPANGKRRK